MHEHTHPHPHTGSDSTETLALLKYLLHHNEHHAEELNELAHQVENDEAHLLLHEAVDTLRLSNQKLSEALARLGEG